MKDKIHFSNRLLAAIISIIFSITLLVSVFTFPIELVLLNDQSYSKVLGSEENRSRYSEIISEALVSELFADTPLAQQPKILSNSENLKLALKNNISTDLSMSVIKDLMDQTLDYLNFRIPSSFIKLDIGLLKSNLILNSEAIALDYVSSLPKCSREINYEFSSGEDNLDVYQLQPCKPSDNLLQPFVNSISYYLEETIISFPATASITGLIHFESIKTDNFYFNYSLGRWGLRLLPLISIGLLISIALLLRSEKDVMLKWIGKLLIYTSVFGLIGLVILLIGFDQFVVLVINPYINNLIKGFGVLLLGVIQNVGYLTLVWVFVSLISILGFGFFLLIIKKLFKPKNNFDNDLLLSQNDLSSEGDVTVIEETQMEKAIKPEILEEIEEQEKKNSKNKNIKS